MKVFLSWSGEQSGHIARELREWLPEVIQALDPWMSKEDIGSGTRWSPEIAKALEESNFGILVVTPDNVKEPWLNFEAGALAKSVEIRSCLPLRTWNGAYRYSARSVDTVSSKACE